MKKINIITIIIAILSLTPTLHAYTRIGEFNTIKVAAYSGSIDNEQALHALQDSLLGLLSKIDDLSHRGIAFSKGTTYTRIYLDPTSNGASKGVIYHMGRRDKPWTGQSCKEQGLQPCITTHVTALDDASYVIESRVSLPTSTSENPSPTVQSLEQALGL